MPARIFLYFLFSFLPSFSKAQTFSGNNYGLNIGLHLAAGSHFDRVGISCNGYYAWETYQVNPGFNIYFNLKNIGPAKKYFEFAPSIGIVYSFGKEDSVKNVFFSPLSNQTIKRNSVGYAFNYFLNNIKTSQATGTISLQFGHFQIISDNDLFAGSIRDEFRLGSALAQYRNKNFQYGINYTGWSGKKGDEVHDRTIITGKYWNRCRTGKKFFPE